MQIRLVKMAGAYSKPFNMSLFWYYIKQIMNVFIRAMVRIFSFGERWNVPFNSAVASLNGTFHLSPHENILTIALINIHYLYTIYLCESGFHFCYGYLESRDKESFPVSYAYRSGKINMKRLAKFTLSLTCWHAICFSL
jgi:hypothetical protein